ncbi:hypothetical protein LZ30DRAFT_786648 [Colletotrichum cereale]|nr:hypothetical protein LZ30DRAFT_786648 [Colletotrichum cereale]
MFSLVHERQVGGLVRFAKRMAWPALGETRGYVEDANAFVSTIMSVFVAAGCTGSSPGQGREPKPARPPAAMRFSAILGTVAAVAASVSAAPLEPRSSFVQVPLPAPLNWVAGAPLFPSQLIAGYNADLGDYTAETWAAYVLDKCKSFSACTSSMTFSGINSGSTGGRYWFGYVFRGGVTTVDSYERDDEAGDAIADSMAYTITA